MAAEDRWLAIRALFEDGAARELLAAAAGLSVTSIARRAAAEGWSGPSEAPGAAERECRLARIRDVAMAQAEAIAADMEAGAAIDKARPEALSALLRMLDRIGEITRLGESAKDNQTERDADMADVLGRIDGRIVELARGYAARLVAAEDRGEEGAADPP